MQYGYGSCGCDPCYQGFGYAQPCYSGFGGNCFVLIVVLFILLIIIGASCYGKL
ncbi:YjcZ family sporulation protein [Bacillus massilinigeriensis]|uniref:YjcZ family sporulation protein n=1 Tax=Bacillus massilionigeriensis TaxID=1805475 RepID=UPI00096B2E12|nr:YjcZ family sporulation protein [Bacillus massilionigeriensis]